jgi:hypothetical protein
MALDRGRLETRLVAVEDLAIELLEAVLVRERAR